MNRHLRISPIAAGLLLAIAMPGAAQQAKGGALPTPLPPLQLSGDGTGQVLLFPYYTVNGGNQTVPTVRFSDGSALTNPTVHEVKARLVKLALG